LANSTLFAITGPTGSVKVLSSMPFAWRFIMHRRV